MDHLTAGALLGPTCGHPAPAGILWCTIPSQTRAHHQQHPRTGYLQHCGGCGTTEVVFNYDDARYGYEGLLLCG